ncbi:hypothetical protein BJ546DRAFT_1064148 [Cryomyces antarcticus]
MGLSQNPKIPDADCNALYLAIFALLLALQLGFSIHYRTWGYLGGMFGGLVLEILGYVGRTELHSNPFVGPPQLVTLTIGPAFLAASIYLCLARLMYPTQARTASPTGWRIYVAKTKRLAPTTPGGTMLCKNPGTTPA